MLRTAKSSTNIRSYLFLVKEQTTVWWYTKIWYGSILRGLLQQTIEDCISHFMLQIDKKLLRKIDCLCLVVSKSEDWLQKSPESSDCGWEVPRDAESHQKWNDASLGEKIYMSASCCTYGKSVLRHIWKLVSKLQSQLPKGLTQSVHC